MHYTHTYYIYLYMVLLPEILEVTLLWIFIYIFSIYLYIHTYVHILYIHIHVSDVRRWYTGIDIFMVLKKIQQQEQILVSERATERKRAKMWAWVSEKQEWKRARERNIGWSVEARKNEARVHKWNIETEDTDKRDKINKGSSYKRVITKGDSFYP